MSSHNRTLRYGAPVATVIVGLLFAAADTHRLGNTVATVLIAAGLVWFMVVVGRDMGMGMAEKSGPRPRVPDPPLEAEDDGDQPPVSPS